MSKRRSPELSTNESGSNYRRGSGGRKSSGGSGGSGRQLGTNLMLALLIGGLVLAGWFIANQQKMIAAEHATANAAETRLARLEARLSATDSALSQGGEDTQEKLGLWESEIRKLWAISNERNKNWIEDNQKSVKSITSTLNGIESSNRDLKASVGRHDTAFTQQQTMIDQLTSLEMQIQQISRGQRDLADKVNAANQAVASLRSGIDSKVDDNSEAIQSIDAYRVAVNSRLADIERRLASVGTPGGG